MATILEMFQLSPQELIFKLFLPFIITLVIFFAVLQMVGLFSRKINLIISLAVTIMIATTPLFATIATWISQFGAFTALIAFVAVFVIGIGAWAFRRSREYIAGALEADIELKKLYKKRAKLLEKLERTSSDRTRAAIYDELENTDRKIRINELRSRHERR